MHFLIIFLVVIGIAAPGEARTNGKLEQEFSLMKMDMKMEMNSIKKEMNNMKQLMMKLLNNKLKMDYEMKNIETEMDNFQSKIIKTYGKNIKKQQTDGFHSFFCAFQPQWKRIGDMTYAELLLGESNIRDATFDIATGQFTAGRAGVYRVDLSIGTILSSSTSNDNDVSIQLNGVDVKGSGFGSHIFTQANSGESAARSMMIGMSEGNVLKVHVSSANDLLDTTFCISYEN